MRHVKANKIMSKIIILFLMISILLNIILPKRVYASKDDLRNFLIKYGEQNSAYASIQYQTDNIYNKLSSIKGFKDLKYEGGKLVLIYDDAYGPDTIKGDIRAAFGAGMGGDPSLPTDVFLQSVELKKDPINAETQKPNKPETPLSEEEQFKQTIGKKYEVSSGAINILWEKYEDKEIGLDGNPKVQVKKDAEGNIVDVILNLNQDEYQNLGIDDTVSNEITEDKNEAAKTDLEGSEQYDWGGVLLKPITALITGIASACNMIMERLFIGGSAEIFLDRGMFDSSEVTEYVGENPPDGNLGTVQVVKEYIDTLMGKYGVPDVRFTSAEIFAGKVAALDANFFEKNSDYTNSLGGEEKSIVLDLKETISAWYVALRNIAIVGLLSVLLYIGIRIVISSSNADKAKYKEFFMDWVIALCLIFFLHYIMAFTMTMAKTVTNVLAGNNSDSKTIKQVNIELINEDGSTFSEGGTAMKFASNFTGVALLKSQYSSSGLALGYSILYLALTIYTAYFAFVYLKRLLMLAFFTMIAPLVALTYPIDKMKDGKAQAFNYWFKEYMFYSLLQPFHMLLYTVFVSSALRIASKNLLYAIVALAFIVPAEKIMKQMFGIKGQTESSIGGFAGGALAAQAFNALRGKNKSNSGLAEQNKIRQAKNPNSLNNMDTLAGDAMGNDVALGAGMATGAAAATAFQNSSDPVADSQREDSEGKLPDGQINPNDLTAEQRAALFGLGVENNGNNDGSNNKNQNFSQEENGVTDQIPFNDKNTNAFKEHKQRIMNNAKKAVQSRWTRAGGAKGMAIKAAKGYGRFVGTATMAGLGLGAGIVGGDMGDTWKGMAAGAAAGSIASKKTNEMIGNIATGNTATGRFVGDVLYGAEGREKRDFMRQYMNDSSTRTRALEEKPNMNVSQLKQRLQQEAEMMYDTGISDYSSIKAAINMEDKLSEGIMSKEDISKIQDKQEREKQQKLRDSQLKRSHNMSVTLAKLGQNYDNSTFTDKAKLQQAQKALSDRIATTMNENPEMTKNMTAEEINKKADAEAAKTLERIRKMKKILK